MFLNASNIQSSFTKLCKMNETYIGKINKCFQKVKHLETQNNFAFKYRQLFKKYKLMNSLISLQPLLFH